MLSQLILYLRQYLFQEVLVIILIIVAEDLCDETIFD
jgi:hypothetical protein